MQIYVCPLAQVNETLVTSGASHLLSLMGPSDMIPHHRDMEPDRHLRVQMNDIVEPGEGLVLPGPDHAAQIIDFASHWDAQAPMVIHCWAGVSRSTAAAFITLCVRNSGSPEVALAAVLRDAAPFARPNIRLVSAADGVLGRGGRMTATIEALPEAEPVPIGRPFSMAADHIG